MEYPWISCSEVAGIKIDKKRWRELIELQKEEFPDTAQEWEREESSTRMGRTSSAEEASLHTR